MTWNPQPADLGVLVVPVSVLRRRKPNIGDVRKLARWQWDEVKNSGQYKPVQLHSTPYKDTGYPPYMLADVAPNPDAVDIYL